MRLVSRFHDGSPDWLVTGLLWLFVGAVAFRVGWFAAVWL